MWSMLSYMSEDECENAAQFFKSGCLKLGLNEEGIDDLCLVIGSYPPSSVYANITPKPSFEGFRTVLDNVKDFLEDGVYESCLALIPQDVLQVKTLDIPLSIQSSSYEFVFLTLIDVMAGCSKIGGGTEDFIAIISGAPKLANLLFQDPIFNRINLMLNKLYKNQGSSYFQFMVPVMFAHAVLLQKNTSSPKSARLPNTMEEFGAIQDQHFCGCLTEASLQSRNAYLDLLRSESYQENPWLAQMIPLELEQELLAVSDEVKKIIKARIRLANENHSELLEHVNVAIRWLDTPYRVVYQHDQFCSIAPSPTLSDRFTPVSDRYTPMSDRYTPMSDGYRSVSTDTFNLFSPVRKTSSADADHFALTVSSEPIEARKLS